MRYLGIFGTIITTFALDQASKYYVLAHAALLPKDITSFFSIDLVWNRGISFGFLNESTLPWVTNGLTALVVAIAFYVSFLLIRTKEPFYRFSLSLVMGGALGNLMDRLYRGAVVDFLDVHIHHYHWPAFNIADSAICIGVALFMWGQLRGKHL